MKQTLLKTPLFLALNLFLSTSFHLSAQTCTVTASANSTNICEGQPVILTGNASYSVGSWKWYREGETTVVSTAQQYQTNIAGKYKLIASGGECGDVESTLVELKAATLPAAPGAISGPTEVCSGSEINYQVAPIEGANAYNWSVPAGWHIIRGQGTPSIAVGIGNGTGYISVQTVNACGESSQTMFMAHSTTGAVAPSVPNVAICAGEYATLAVAQPNHSLVYKWFDKNSTLLATGATYITSPLLQSATYYVRAENTCGPSQLVEVVVAVSPAVANNTISSDQVMCMGQIPMLISGALPTGGSGNYVYQWERSVTGPDGGFVVITSANSQNYQPSELSYTTWFRRRVAGGCSQSISNTVKITVAPTPAKPVANDASVAYGQSATLSVISPQHDLAYKWYSAGGLLLATGASYNTSALTVNTVYYVEAVGVAGCVSERAAVTVTVNSAIGNNVIGAEQSVCTGQIPAVLTGSEPTGGNGVYTYQWEHSEDGVNFVPIPEATAKDYTPGALSLATWFRRKVGSGSGESNTSNSVKVTVVDSPVAPGVVPVNVCTGYSARLKVWQPNPGYTYRWYQIGFEDSPIEGVEITTVPITQDTAYYLEAVNKAGCVSTRTKYIVRVVEAFSENNIGEPQEICAGDVPAQLGGLAPQNGVMYFEYFWEASTDGVNYTPAPGWNDSKYYQPNALTQTTWFRRSAVSEFCPASVSTPVKITVLPQPPKPGISKGTTTLTASVAGVAYIWFKDGEELSNANTQSITFDAAGSYKVRVQNEQGCFSDFSDAIQVAPQPSGMTAEAEKAGIKVSPNPAAGSVTLRAQHPLRQVQVVLVNAVGKTVYSETIDDFNDQQSIDVSHLPAGMYLVHIKADKLQAVQRLVIAK